MSSSHLGHTGSLLSIASIDSVECMWTIRYAYFLVAGVLKDLRGESSGRVPVGCSDLGASSVTQVCDQNFWIHSCNLPMTLSVQCRLMKKNPSCPCRIGRSWQFFRLLIILSRKRWMINYPLRESESGSSQTMFTEPNLALVTHVWTIVQRTYLTHHPKPAKVSQCQKCARWSRSGLHLAVMPELAGP